MDYENRKHYFLDCPILQRKIDDGYCFEISMVAERLVQETTLPKEVQDISKFQEICLQCKNHRYD